MAQFIKCDYCGSQVQEGETGAESFGIFPIRRVKGGGIFCRCHEPYPQCEDLEKDTSVVLPLSPKIQLSSKMVEVDGQPTRLDGPIYLF